MTDVALPASCGFPIIYKLVARWGLEKLPRGMMPLPIRQVAALMRAGGGGKDITSQHGTS